MYPERQKEIAEQIEKLVSESLDGYESGAVLVSKHPDHGIVSFAFKAFDIPINKHFQNLQYLVDGTISELAPSYIFRISNMKDI